MQASSNPSSMLHFSGSYSKCKLYLFVKFQALPSAGCPQQLEGSPPAETRSLSPPCPGSDHRSVPAHLGPQGPGSGCLIGSRPAVPWGEAAANAGRAASPPRGRGSGWVEARMPRPRAGWRKQSRALQWLRQ